MVTAGHCTDGVDSGRVYFQQSAAPNYDPAAFGGWGGDPTTGYPYENGITFSRADDYGFDNFAGYPETHDVGVVVLDRPVSRRTASAILPARRRDRPLPGGRRTRRRRRALHGQRLRPVGPDPRRVSFRERLMARVVLVNNEAPVTEFNLKTTANASQGKGGTCNGDSGGPVFFGATNVIAAVTSFGMNGKCKGLGLLLPARPAGGPAWITTRTGPTGLGRWPFLELGSRGPASAGPCLFLQAGSTWRIARLPRPPTARTMRFAQRS